LTAAARGANLNAGRDEETAPSVELRNCTRYWTILQNFPHNYSSSPRKRGPKACPCHEQGESD
jgi:hypothetical protein